MNLNVQLQKQLHEKITGFPLLFACCADYIDWVLENVSDGIEKYDFITYLQVHSLLDIDEQLEISLQKSKQILGIDSIDFIRRFGFKKELQVDDSQKIWDVLAEVFLVIDLDSEGFSEITKLKPIKDNNKYIATADFTAFLGETKFAIELKVVRIENNIQPGQSLGNPFKANWWGEMYRSNAIFKIEDDNRKVIKQLSNTCKHFHANTNFLSFIHFDLGYQV